MKYEAIPRLKFEIEGMRTAIVSHLGVEGSEVGEVLDEEIKKAVAEFPWQERVSCIVHEALNDEISAYFRYGSGHKLVKDSVEEGFKAVLTAAGETANK